MNEEMFSADNQEQDGEVFLERSSIQEISNRLLELVESQEEDALHRLHQLFVSDPEYRSEVPRLICRAILAKGAEGTQILKEEIIDRNNNFLAPTAFEALWYASKNQVLPVSTADITIPSRLDQPPDSKTVEAASTCLSEIIEESQGNSHLYAMLTASILQILAQPFINGMIRGEENEDKVFSVLRSFMFEIFTEPAIKITKRLIKTFEALIDEQRSEECYQKFLSEHPVFIDPLANHIVPKNKLGSDLVTDFVIQRLDNEYLLVEIEKPHDPIFTKKNDFSSEFTHAFGQVIDFQEWAESNLPYAHKHMPGISAPRGILIIGRNNQLSENQKAKLKRFCINSRAIEVLTYDDLLRRAKNLYNNIHRKTAHID